MIDEEGGLNSINIPPKLPVILKQFCKAAIRTQPYDLLKWSTAYFNALAEGSEPPAKTRLEYPCSTSAPNASVLTFGLLKVLLRQFGDYNKTISTELILKRWNDLCLDLIDFNLIMIVGKFKRKCQIKKFLAIATGLLGSSLFDTMLMICELFTMEPDGGSAMIPVSLFMEIYEYLAGLRCDGEERESNDLDPSELITFESSETQCTSEPTSEENIINFKQDYEFNVSEIKVRDQSVIKNSLSKNLNKLVQNESDTGIRKIEDVNVLENDDDKLQSKQKKSMDNSDGLMLHSNGSNLNTRSVKISGDDSDSKTITSDDNIDNNNKNKLSGIKKKFKINSNWISHYPMIPGIGAQLTSNEVAKVANWMTECSKVQGGMVGPRNLRHFQCPPLDRQKTSSSLS
ncbi:uncharacterized protein LOC130678656 [Microplitis mediator]|uniref:uncharacterized protein LOC130678656 n=1 Tax=Microplitis mediator TaxID=375433 RepID=UPI0025553B83|nr:uncharacterized protein LOC130678656 [Microplitis mediator]